LNTGFKPGFRGRCVPYHPGPAPNGRPHQQGMVREPLSEAFCLPKTNVLSSEKEYLGVVPFRTVNRGLGMLATILLLMAGMTVASGVAVLCGIKAPIETDGEW